MLKKLVILLSTSSHYVPVTQFGVVENMSYLPLLVSGFICIREMSGKLKIFQGQGIV